jgi:uncharacterized protein (DUF39 family)
MPKTLDELNQQVKRGEPVVVDARDITGTAPAAAPPRTPDTVTAGTVGPMLYFARRLPPLVKKEPE